MINTIDRGVIKCFYRELYIHFLELNNRPAYKEHIARIRANEACGSNHDHDNYDDTRITFRQRMSFYDQFFVTFYK